MCLHSLISRQGAWENSRQLCKPSTASQFFECLNQVKQTRKKSSSDVINIRVVALSLQTVVSDRPVLTIRKASLVLTVIGCCFERIREIRDRLVSAEKLLR